jgi:hypothetical protein
MSEHQLEWNAATQQWLCIKCLRCSIQSSREDAEVEFNQFECRPTRTARPEASRSLRIVKLTPIALSFCEACQMEFRSTEQVEEDAEAEMKKLFEKHICGIEPILFPRH